MRNPFKLKYNERRAVRKGAKRMDERQPGWAERVDPETIDIHSGFACVIGQATGKYVDFSHFIDEGENIGDLGFNTLTEKLPDDVLDGLKHKRAIEDAWRDEVTKRRSDYTDPRSLAIEALGVR